MEVKKVTFFALFLALLLVASQNGISGVEGKLCKIKSGDFNGPCFADTNCAQICIGEGFYDGKCEGLRRLCVCQTIC